MTCILFSANQEEAESIDNWCMYIFSIADELLSSAAFEYFSFLAMGACSDSTIEASQLGMILVCCQNMFHFLQYVCDLADFSLFVFSMRDHSALTITIATPNCILLCTVNIWCSFTVRLYIITYAFIYVSTLVPI